MKRMGVKGALKTFDHGHGAHYELYWPRTFRGQLWSQIFFVLFLFFNFIRAFTDRGSVRGGSKKPLIMLFYSFINF